MKIWKKKLSQFGGSRKIPMKRFSLCLMIFYCPLRIHHCMLLPYLIHPCQTDKALLYSRLQLFQLKLLVYFLCVRFAKKTALYIQKYHFDNDKGFSKKKLFISALVLYICVSCAKELRRKKYHAGAGSLLSLDLHHSFLKLNIRLKMHFWVSPANYTVKFCFLCFTRKGSCEFLLHLDLHVHCYWNSADVVATCIG